MGSRLRALAVSVVAILLFIGPASAQDWPVKATPWASLPVTSTMTATSTFS